MIADITKSAIEVARGLLRKSSATSVTGLCQKIERGSAIANAILNRVVLGLKISLMV